MNHLIQKYTDDDFVAVIHGYRGGIWATRRLKNESMHDFLIRLYDPKLAEALDEYDNDEADRILFLNYAHLNIKADNLQISWIKENEEFMPVLYGMAEILVKPGPSYYA